MRTFENSFDSTKSRLLIGGAAAALVIGSLVTISKTGNTVKTITSPPHASVTHTPNTTSTPNTPNTPSKQSISPSIIEAVHKDIIATVFWVGEAASADNDYIQNRSSTWQEDWMGHYGGVDDPETRCDYKPCAFTPKENPFYFALPFNDYQDNGQPKPAVVLQRIPWYTGQPQPGMSLVKNHWVEIINGNIKTYAQWEDAGPFGENDVAYVFGNARPAERRAGIDLSPATADYLHIDGSGNVTWKFVEDTQVPAGPWKEIITSSGIEY